MPTVQLDYTGTSEPFVGGQADFANDFRHRFIALEGGWGSGKTWVGARHLITLHVYNAFDLQGNPTYIASAIISPTYRSALDYDVPEIQKACDEIELDVIWKSSEMAFIFPSLSSGRHISKILMRTADAPERITGWEVGAAWGDEVARWKEDFDDPRYDPYIQLTGRVRAPLARFRQIIFTYTNEGDATRIYEEMHKGYDTHKLYRASTKDNPIVKEFYDQQRALLSSDLGRQYLDGEALNLRGALIYSSFDRRYNVDKKIEYIPDRPLHLSLDFNIAPGMHAELGQYVQEADVFTVFDEIHAPRLDVRGVVSIFASKIKRLCKIAKLGTVHIFGDATGQSEWAGTGESCYRILRQGLDALGISYRLRVPASNPLVVDRINAMQMAFLDMTGGVHYKIHPRCERLITDLNKLRRDNKTGDIQKKDKQLSHASDAEGYRVYYLRPGRVIRESTVGAPIAIAD